VSPTNLIVPTPPLPVEGTVDVDVGADRLWAAFLNVRRWSRWNRSIWRSWVVGGELAVGAKLWLVFNPLEPLYLYKLPAPATIVELEPGRTLTWEVNLAGFHALHRYHVEPLAEGRCRFGTLEVAEGPMYFALRGFWLAHFRFVRDRSLAGAPYVACGLRRRYTRMQTPRKNAK
jgi:hypothetical protein